MEKSLDTFEWMLVAQSSPKKKKHCRDNDNQLFHEAIIYFISFFLHVIFIFLKKYLKYIKIIYNNFKFCEGFIILALLNILFYEF